MPVMQLYLKDDDRQKMHDLAVIAPPAVTVDSWEPLEIRDR